MEVFNRSALFVWSSSSGKLLWLSCFPKGFGGTFLIVFARHLGHRSRPRFRTNFGCFLVPFSPQDAKKSVPGGSSRTIRFFIDFWTRFFRILADFGSQLGVNFGTISAYFGRFGRFGCSWGRRRPPCSSGRPILVDFWMIFKRFLCSLGVYFWLLFLRFWCVFRLSFRTFWTGFRKR